VGLFADVGQKLGIERSGYSMFFDALSFRFYCLLMIAFIFLHILTGRDFGPMATAEQLANKQDGKFEIPGTPTLAQVPARAGMTTPAEGPRFAGTQAGAGWATNALIPLGGLILFHIIGLWTDGDGLSRLRQGGSLLSWVYWRQVISNAGHSHLILFYAAVFGVTLALLCGVVSKLRLAVICRCFGRGFKRAMLPFALLILAWSLKNCCDNLKTGEFLTTILAGRVSPNWFPAIVFLVACVTSFATGTS